MELFGSALRLTYLKYLMKAYRPSINVQFIKKELGFESNEKFQGFIKDKIVTTNGIDIDCKETFFKIKSL